MPICLATGSVTSDHSILAQAAIAFGLLVLGWFFKVVWDGMSQKRLFDHRLRLEKEYGLYSDLWEKLFELRRALSQIVEPLQSSGDVRHDNQILDFFNAYNSAVNKGEPFMSTSVFGPAKEVRTLARKIMSNVERERALGKRRKGPMDENDGKLAEEQFKLENDSISAFEKINDLSPGIAQAIHRRVTP